MRNISFALTTAQIRNRTKTVTRRIGWTFLKPGDVLRAVEKGQGLTKGETVRPLAIIRVVSVRVEPLGALLQDLDYGIAEVAREGFSGPPVDGSPTAFVEFFQNTHRASDRHLETLVTRIEFTYEDPHPPMR